MVYRFSLSFRSATAISDVKKKVLGVGVSSVSNCFSLGLETVGVSCFISSRYHSAQRPSVSLALGLSHYFCAIEKTKKKKSQGPDNLRTGKKKKRGPDRKKKKKKNNQGPDNPKTGKNNKKKKNLYREPVSLFSSYCDSLGDCAALRLALQAICH